MGKVFNLVDETIANSYREILELLEAAAIKNMKADDWMVSLPIPRNIQAPTDCTVKLDYHSNDGFRISAFWYDGRVVADTGYHQIHDLDEIIQHWHKEKLRIDKRDVSDVVRTLKTDHSLD